MNRPVILIGFMGCGKTTVGKSVSYKLRIPFVDTDHYLESEEKKSISDIFAEHGEEHFRELETKYLIEILSKRQDHVISTGGGLVVRQENRNIINAGKNKGRVIYLSASPEVIYDRVKGNDKRPLLQCEDPLAKIRTLLKEREEAYKTAADVIIYVDDKSPDEIADEITAMFL